MKFSTKSSMTFALSLLTIAASCGVASATTFQATDSAYVTKSAPTEDNTGGNLNLVGAGVGNSNDFDVYEFGTSALSGTASSVAITLFNNNGVGTAGKYATGGSTGSTAGLVDFYLASVPTNLVGNTTSDIGTVNNSSVLPASSLFASGGYGLGVQSSLATGATPTYIALGQVNFTTADLAAASNTFSFSNLSAGAVTELDSLGTTTNGLELIVTDDSSQYGTGAADSFYAAGAGANNATFAVTTSSAAPAPESSSLIVSSVALALLGGMTFFGMKRRQNS